MHINPKYSDPYTHLAMLNLTEHNDFPKQVTLMSPKNPTTSAWETTQTNKTHHHLTFTLYICQTQLVSVFIIGDRFINK